MARGASAQHRRPRSRAFGVLCLGALSACQGGDDHELGYTRDPEAVGSQPRAPFFTEEVSFIGRFLGEAREPLAFGVDDEQPAPVYIFPSGSSRVLLTIEAAQGNEGAVLGGSIRFGSGEPPESLTAPELLYPVAPPDAGAPSPQSYGLEGEPAGLPPLEGYAYALASPPLEAGVPDGVLRLQYNPGGHLEQWCGLQPPHPLPDGTFGVLPYAAGGVEVLPGEADPQCSAHGAVDLSACPSNLSELPTAEYLATYVACHRRGPVLYQMRCRDIFLSRFCSCTETGCGADSGRQQASLLLRATGEGLIGVLDGAVFLNARGLLTPLGELRFRRLDD